MKSMIRVFKLAQRVDRWAGQLIDAPRGLAWSDGSAGMYAFGLGLRIVAAGLGLVLAVLLLMSIVAFAPPLAYVAGLSFGVMLLFAGHVIYPSWTQAVSFHIAFAVSMGMLPLALSSGMAAGLSPAELGQTIAICIALGFGQMVAFGLIEQIWKVMLEAFKPAVYVWGSKALARHNVRVIRRAQRRSARRAKRA